MISKGIATGFILVLVTLLLSLVFTYSVYEDMYLQLISISITFFSILYFGFYFINKYVRRVLNKKRFSEIILLHEESIILKGFFKEKKNGLKRNGNLILTNKRLVFQYSNTNTYYNLEDKDVNLKLNRIGRLIYTGLTFQMGKTKKYIKIDYANDWKTLLEETNCFTRS